MYSLIRLTLNTINIPSWYQEAENLDLLFSGFFFLSLGHRSFPLFSWAAVAMTTEVDPLDSLPSGVKLLLRHLHALIPEKLSDINYPT